MRGNVKINGLVLSAMPVGEYDKRIVILTKEMGKISAFSRAARRPNSSLVGVSNPFVYGEFDAFRGSNSYTVNKVNASNYFAGITSDLDKMFLGTYFLEVADYYAQENVDEKERLLLLYKTLQVLEKGQMSASLIRAVYEFRTMVINGVYPNVFQCEKCGSKEHLVSLSSSLEGLECVECTSGKRPLMQSTVYTLQYVASATVAKLFSFELKKDVEEEFVNLVNVLRTKYMKHDFKSEQFIGL